MSWEYLPYHKQLVGVVYSWRDYRVDLESMSV
jgi:hypothetical protein